jgi:hypothetical protein
MQLNKNEKIMSFYHVAQQHKRALLYTIFIQFVIAFFVCEKKYCYFFGDKSELRERESLMGG